MTAGGSGVGRHGRGAKSRGLQLLRGEGGDIGHRDRHQGGDGGFWGAVGKLMGRGLAMADSGHPRVIWRAWPVDSQCVGSGRAR